MEILKKEDEKYWNADLQGIFEIVDHGLRQMLRRKKITSKTYNMWCKETEQASIGKLE